VRRPGLRIVLASYLVRGASTTGVIVSPPSSPERSQRREYAPDYAHSDRLTHGGGV